MDRQSFYNGMLEDPLGSGRGVFADYLEERGEPDANFHRWLYETGRRPIYLPTGHQYWLAEGKCAAVQFTLPQVLLYRVNPKAQDGFAIHCQYGHEFDVELAKAFNLANNGLLNKVLGKNFTPGPLPAPILAPDCELKIMRDETYYDGYEVVGALRKTNLELVLNSVMSDRNAGGPFITIQFGQWFFPTVDADNATGSTEAFCNLNGIGYLKVESSPANYWYILDVPCANYEMALGVCRFLPENDLNFIRASNTRGMFNLRGERRQTVPTVIENTMETNIGRNFATKWLKYWQDGRLNEIYRWRNG